MARAARLGALCYDSTFTRVLGTRGTSEPILKDLVGADMSTVSKHLSMMRQAGVLVSDKRGLNIYYRLACDCLGDFLRCLDQLAPKKATTKPCC